MMLRIFVVYLQRKSQNATSIFKNTSYMGNEIIQLQTTEIENKILVIRNCQVMIDRDLGKKCFAFEILEDASTLIPAILANV